MSRRILVRISPTGDIVVEADGFQGNGCEAATKAIEEALGHRTAHTRKPEYWRQSQTGQQNQQLGEGGP